MSVVAAKGFRVGGTSPVLVVNDGPDATAAGVFPGDGVKAAPVLWSQQVLRGGIVRVVVLTPGGPRAYVGPQGFQETHAIAEHTAATLTRRTRLVLGAGEVVVCSIDGPAQPLTSVLPALTAAARALSRDPGARRGVVVAGGGYTVGGSGYPPGVYVLTTDAVAASDELRAALARACQVTFDRRPGDAGVLLLASGASGIEPSLSDLTRTVTAACHDLAYVGSTS